MFMQIWAESSVLAKFSLILAVAPLVMGVIYALRPSEARLALMRPLSLAGLFAGLAGLLIGLINVIRGMSAANMAGASGAALLGVAEAMVPLAVSFGCLTVGWLCVTLGLMRQP
jgi:hypothetical protein